MLNSTVSLNVANSRGGVIHVSSQAGTNGTTINNCTINSNTALLDGGGLVNGAGILTIQNSTVSTNAAFGDGGGIWSPGAITLRNCTVTQNHSDNNNNSTADQGGGIFRSFGTAPAVTLGQGEKYPQTVIAPGKGPFTFPEGYQTPWEKVDLDIEILDGGVRALA